MGLENKQHLDGEYDNVRGEVVEGDVVVKGLEKTSALIGFVGFF